MLSALVPGGHHHQQLGYRRDTRISELSYDQDTKLDFTHTQTHTELMHPTVRRNNSESMMENPDTGTALICRSWVTECRNIDKHKWASGLCLWGKCTASSRKRVIITVRPLTLRCIAVNILSGAEFFAQLYMKWCDTPNCVWLSSRNGKSISCNSHCKGSSSACPCQMPQYSAKRVKGGGELIFIIKIWLTPKQEQS